MHIDIIHTIYIYVSKVFSTTLDKVLGEITTMTITTKKEWRNGKHKTKCDTFKVFLMMS